MLICDDLFAHLQPSQEHTNTLGKAEQDNNKNILISALRHFGTGSNKGDDLI
jgi:hypothetical protein